MSSRPKSNTRWIGPNGRCPGCGESISTKKKIISFSAKSPHQCELKPEGIPISVVRCPQCEAALAGVRDTISTEFDQRLPPFDELHNCPLCGNLVRQLDGKIVYQVDDRWQVSKHRLKCGKDTHSRFSSDSRYCIIDGEKLRPYLRFDFADEDSQGAFDGHLGTPVVFSGCKAVVRYPCLRPGMEAWDTVPQGQLVTPSQKPPGWSLNVPVVSRLQEWTIQPLIRHADDQILPGPEKLRARIVPAPQASLWLGSESILLPPDSSLIRATAGTKYVAVQLDFPEVHSDEDIDCLNSVKELWRLRWGTKLFLPEETHKEKVIFYVELPVSGSMTIHPWNRELGALTVEESDARLLSAATQLERPAPAQEKGFVWRHEGGEWTPLKALLPVVADAKGRWPKESARIELALVDDEGNTLEPATGDNDEASKREIEAQTWVDPLAGGQPLLPTIDLGRKGAEDTWLEIPFEELRANHANRGTFILKTGAISTPVRLVLITANPVLTTLDSSVDEGADSSAWTYQNASTIGKTIVLLKLSEKLTATSPDHLNLQPTAVTLSDSAGNMISQSSYKSTDDGLILSLPQKRTTVLCEVTYRQAISCAVLSFSLAPVLSRRQVVDAVRQDPLITTPLSSTEADDEHGIPARPILAVGLTTRVEIGVSNKLSTPVFLSAQPLKDNRSDTVVQLRADYSGANRPIAIPANDHRLIQLIVKPSKPTGNGLWDISVPIVRPKVGADLAVQVPYTEVLPKQQCSMLYYDFGTSNTAVSASYEGQDAYLREPGCNFVRSRAVVVWSEDDWEEWAPSKMLVGDDARMEIPSAQEDMCAYAELDRIKTEFRRAESNYVVKKTFPGATKKPTRPLYQAKPFAAFQEAQEVMANYVYKQLGFSPQTVLTAFPIILRGHQREAALWAIQQAFANVTGGDGSESKVLVQAPLDEGTAASIEALLDTKNEGHVLGIDIGGGTTEMTLYEVTLANTSVPTIECIGFDGIAAGGRFVTNRVIELLQHRICGIYDILPPNGIPIDSEQDGRSPGEPGLKNHALLWPIAEKCKIALQSDQLWRVSPDDLAELEKLYIANEKGSAAYVRIADVGLTPRLLDLSLAPEKLFEDPQYEALIDELVVRGQHAGNLRYEQKYEVPKLLKLVLTGQASSCEHLMRRFESQFATSVERKADTRESEAIARKKSTVRGLRRFATEVRGTKREKGFKVGSLERVVLYPVGTSDWGSVILPRFHPLNVPVTMFDEQETDEGRGVAIVQPRMRFRPGVGKGDESDTTATPPTLAHDVYEEEIDPHWGFDELEWRTQRFRYCIWIGEDDELYGQLYERWYDTSEPAKYSSWNDDDRAANDIETFNKKVSGNIFAKHPAFSLIKMLLNEEQRESAFFHLDWKRHQARPDEDNIQPIQADIEGVGWVTYCEVFNPSTPGFDDLWRAQMGDYGAGTYLMWGETAKVSQNESDDRRIPIAFQKRVTAKMSFIDLAESVVRRVVNQDVPGVGQICGVRIPKVKRGAKPDEPLIVTFLPHPESGPGDASQVNRMGPVFVEIHDKGDKTEETWWKPRTSEAPDLFPLYRKRATAEWQPSK